MTVPVSAYGKVAVLMGGWAAEREVSLVSGGAVLRGLLEEGVDAHGIDVDRSILEVLRRGGYQRAFNVLHGRGGEDGVIQGALEVLGVPYTGSGVLGSALSMDKYRCKLLWRGLGLPTPEFVLLRDRSDLERVRRQDFPVMVKPVHEGSSLGIARADDAGQLQRAWNDARRYDDLVLAERWIEGAEYTVTLLDDRALPLIRLETDNAFYDFQAKYESDDTRYLVPCGLEEARERSLQELALQAFQAIGASGWGRVDLLLDQRQHPWLIEANTVPGMTGHSLVPMAARAAGLEFNQLLLRILARTLEP